MKIVYLKLQGFKNIMSAMNVKTLELDLSKSKNKVILFSGPNGSGKTSILSSLHPFANNGSLDIRSSHSLISDNEKGYKEIHIKEEDDLYIIKHYYTPTKDTHTVKSYIMKNDEELNPNGNVTSFKTIVEEELSIELDYLKLLRLGSNVVNFIELSPTERKAYMGKLMSDIDVYMMYFKKMTSKLKSLNALITHNNTKLTRLNISDISEAKKQYESIVKKLDSSNKFYMDMTNERAISINSKSEIGHYLAISEELHSVLSEIKEIESLLNSKKHNEIMKGITNLDLYKNDLKDRENELNINMNNKSMYLESVDKLYSELKSLEIELKKETNDTQIKELEKIIESLSSKINRQSILFNGFNPGYTSTDVEQIISICEQSQNILLMSYEFGNDVVKKSVKHIKKNDTEEFVKSKLKSLVNNKLTITANFIRERLYSKFPIVYANCSDTSCPLYQFWNEFHELADIGIEKEDLNDEEFYSYMNLATSNITKAISLLSSKKDIFIKMPDKLQNEFLLSTIFDHISKCEWIYSKPALYQLLSQVTEFEIYNDDREKLRDYQSQLNALKGSSSKAFLTDRLSKVNNEILSIRESIDSIDEKVYRLNQDIEDLSDLVSKSEKVKLSIDKKDIVNDRIKELQNKLDRLKDLENKIKGYNKSIDDVNLEMNKLNKMKNELHYKIQEYKIIKQDLLNIQEEYDDCDLIRKSLSSKEGMPMMLIEYYLGDTAGKTNDLLDIVYDGKLFLKDFNITPTEFSIPFIVNNSEVSDAKYASQGELSFITVALSFALASKSLTKYNIMLLDEIDSTLDSSNRKKFLDILEKQMDISYAEQVWVISHNDMYDSYPVDVIDLYNIDKCQFIKLS